jgi:MFS family permease
MTPDLTAAPGCAARATVAALAACVLLASLGTSVANVLLPGLATHFGASPAWAQWVVLAYLLALTVATVVAGRLGDLHGRRRVLLAGIALYTVAAGVAACAPTLARLAVARAAQGLGAAAMMALAMALLRDVVPAGGTGRAMGLLGTVSALGTALGPSVGGAVAAIWGWRAAFALLVPMGAIVLVVLRAELLVDATRTRPAKARAAALPGGFRKTLRESLVPNALVSTVMMATLIVGPFYMARGLAMGEAAIGLALSVGPAMSIAWGIPAGRAVDRFGTRPMAFAGLAALAAGSLALAVLPAAMGLASYLAGIALLTPGYQLFQAANNTAALAGVAADRRGVVSGLLTFSRNVGLAAGAAAMGTIYTLAARAAGGSAMDAAASAVRTTFLVATVLAVLALACAAPWRDRR